MSKITDNKSKYEEICPKATHEVPSQMISEPEQLITPIKKSHAIEGGSQSFSSILTPFQLPPKLNNPSTAMTIGFNSFSQDMKMIQTPLQNKFGRLDVAGIDDDMHDNLRAISSKIDWEKTPIKSQNPNSDQYDDEDQSHSNSQGSQSYSRISEQQQISQKSQNPQTPHLKQHPVLQKPVQIETPPIQKKKSSKKLQSKGVPVPPVQQNKKVFCNCKKTKCLKLYCDCFRINQTCDGCNCAGCHNLEEYSEERSQAILALMDRNPDPFSQKIQADKHLKGCNCKKSACMKKYCECFQAGLGCGENCKCQECKNGGGSLKRAKQAQQKAAKGQHIKQNAKDVLSLQM